MKRSYDMGRVQCVVVLFLFHFWGEGGNDILLALLHWEFINNTLFYRVTLYNKVPLVNIS